MNEAPNVGAVSLIETGIEALIDYTIWFPKVKPGKQGSGQSFESPKPTNNLKVTITGDTALSFKAAKLHILSEINKHELLAVTLLRAADKGEGELGNLKWHVYISTSKLYPKTGGQIVFITSDEAWKEWLDVCKVSKDKVCGINLVMQNPAVEQKKKRKSLLLQAAKITRRNNRVAAKQPKKTPGNNNLTPEEMALDDEGQVELTSDEISNSSGSTGGDTDTDAVKIVADLIYKRHPIKSHYSTSVPVFVDPTNTDRFFYITTGMSRLWATEKLACDATGSKVVTIDIPPKASGIQWLSRSDQQMNRNKPGPGSNSSLRDMALMIKEVFGPIGQPTSDPLSSISGPTLKAPMSDYLSFCNIPDLDGSIKERLAGAGIDEYSLFDQEFLPHQDLTQLNLSTGTIARLYMNVKAFSKKLNDEQVK
ncbi:uncharacterized protein MELLADRAFT_95196 [Melampsora larici-populina 98AG31]|uniref:Uncharacterized protein n=1 Tax=Melampsora larici-populina (strain 98AG31 / pathotype 3-4-7) TaxID=747676 RepID=F4RCH0_MELLP|nr:uncharacterized protein MELLADRAFT_95196 [Melampsora larici-populina 98AG31]EGG09730.1 hypothetical protein MELLADRAFT_95196 [Melampsora larici-populina 98AG31]